jgi:hypothetical protein
MRIIGSVVLSSLALLLAVPASAKGIGFGRGVGVVTGSVLLPTRHPVLGPVGAPTRVGPMRGDATAFRVAHAPVLPLRKTTGPRCFFRIYAKLSIAGQDHDLATAGAALLCGWSP